MSKNSCSVISGYLSTIKKLPDFNLERDPREWEELEFLLGRAGGCRGTLEEQQLRSFFCLEVVLGVLVYSVLTDKEAIAIISFFHAHPFPRSIDGLVVLRPLIKKTIQELDADLFESNFGHTGQMRLQIFDLHRKQILFQYADRIIALLLKYLRARTHKDEFNYGPVGKLLGQCCVAMHELTSKKLTIGHWLIDTTIEHAPRAWDVYNDCHLSNGGLFTQPE